MPSLPTTRRALALVLIAALPAAFSDAQANDFVVYTPYVYQSQTELEVRGYRFDDSRLDVHGEQGAEFSVAHAFTSWWKPELYVVNYEREPGAGGQTTGYEFENTLQITTPGEHWADIGFLASYEHSTLSDEHDELEFGPLVTKTIGRFTHTFNAIFEKELGTGLGGKYEHRYAYSGTYAVSKAFRPGIEIYARPSDDAYHAGPVVNGEWHVPGTTGNIEYRLGVAFGVNRNAADRTWMAQLEYEFF
jgi:hypothetical protein